MSESLSPCVCGASPHEPYCASPEAFAERTAGVDLAICVRGHTTVHDPLRDSSCRAYVGRKHCGARISGQRARREITVPLDRDCLCCGNQRAAAGDGCPACNLTFTQVTELNSGVLDRHFGTVRDPDRFVV